jgi:hypothetical protein
MPIVNANKTLTDELEIWRKLTVVVSSGGSASLRMYQAGQDLGAIQLYSGSNTFGPFTSAINYAVDCFSGFADVNESQPSDDAIVLADGPEESSGGDYDFPAIIGPASLRGISARGGFPNTNTAGQLLGKSVWKNIGGDKPDGFRFLFVGVSAQTETPATSGTLRAKCKTPDGSWFDITFNAASSGQFTAGGNYILISDNIPYSLENGQEVELYESGINTLPTCLNGDWIFEQVQNREYSLQLNGTNEAAMQVNQLNTVQLENAKMNPRTYFATGATWSSASGGTLTINLPTHSQVSVTNIKVLLSGFMPSAINGLRVPTIVDTNTITVPLASDPGATTNNGLVQFIQIPTATTWTGGVLTVTRASHGYLPGEVISHRGYTTTGTSLNRDFEIDTVPDANTYTVKLSSDPGTITLTSAYIYRKYMDAAINNFHLRPLAMLGVGTVECDAIISDSTQQSVDLITDETRLCGVVARLIGLKIPFIDLACNNDSLTNWVTTNPAQHAVRNYIAGLLCQQYTLGMSKNDEALYTTVASADTWKAQLDAFNLLPTYAPMAARGKNKAVLAPTKFGSSSPWNDYSTPDGQSESGSYAALPIWHAYLKSKLGTIFNKIFDYQSTITVFNQPPIYKCYESGARIIIVTGTTTTPIVTVDSSTPIYPEDNGKIIGIPGASGTGNGILYCLIKYRSATSFVAMFPLYKNRVRSGMGIAVTNANAILGSRRFINQDNTQSDTVHESPLAIRTGTGLISLK